MKKESLLLIVVGLIVGLLGGYLIFSISSSGKTDQVNSAIPAGAGSPTDYTQRIAQAEKLVEQDPKNLKAWISLGNDYFDTEQAQKAINAYNKALDIEPNNPNVLTDQGVMYRKVGWYDKALINFEKANKIDPNHLQSLYNAGIVYAVDMKQMEKAAPYWNKYLSIDANSPTAIQIKNLLEQPSKAMSPPMK